MITKVPCKSVAYVVQISEWDYISGYVIKDYQLFTEETAYRAYLESADVIKRAVMLVGIGLQIIGESSKHLLETGGGYAVVKNYKL